MSKQQWLMKKQTKPPVSWDGKTKTFSIALKGLKGVIEGDGIEAEWSPPITYVVRIREVGSSKWSIGFETPITGCGFVGLKSDSDYELEVRSKNVYGESEPALIKVRTNPRGNLGI